jgi:hypothetical protein
MMIDLLFSAGKNDFTFLLALCRLLSAEEEENKKRPKKLATSYYIMVY